MNVLRSKTLPANSVCAVLSCLTLFGISLAQTAQSTEQNIVQFVARYDNAWQHKDAATVNRMLATEYVYFTSKGKVKPRQELLDMVLSPNYTLASSERSDINVYRVSDTVVVGSRWKGHGSYHGREFQDDQRCSMVLARKNHEWQVLSEHCTPIVGQ